MHTTSKRAAAHLPRLIAVAALAAAASAATAAFFTLQGSFLQDDDVRLFSVTVASGGLVGITSRGYAGGTASSGVTIAAGTLVAFSGDSPDAPVDPGRRMPASRCR